MDSMTIFLYVFLGILALGTASFVAIKVYYDKQMKYIEKRTRALCLIARHCPSLALFAARYIVPEKIWRKFLAKKDLS